MPQSHTVYQTRVTRRQEDNLSKAANSLSPSLMIKSRKALNTAQRGSRKGIYLFPAIREIVISKLIFWRIYPHTLFRPMKESIGPVGEACLSIWGLGWCTVKPV